jgi:hypothetical protein
MDNWGSIPKKSTDFSLYLHIQTGSEAYPISYPMDTVGPFHRGKVAAA